MDTFFGELARQLAGTYNIPDADAAARAGRIRAAVVDGGFTWVETDGPAFRATYKALGITRPTVWNLDAFVFNHD